MTVINIRGTHGSGKSTLIQKLLKQYDGVAIRMDNKIKGYKISAPEFRKPLYVVGPYETQCGGADAIQPYANIWPLVEEFARRGHVIFEGALISSCVGSIGVALAKRKDGVACFLDTPLEVCLARIARRRIAKGNHAPLNPANTAAKHASSQRARLKLESLGLRCVTIEYEKATLQVMEVLLENRKG